MILDIDELAVLVNPVRMWVSRSVYVIISISITAPFEGMASVSVVMSPSLRCTVITEKHHPGMVTMPMLDTSLNSLFSCGPILTLPVC
jgi:hypothetical protein